MSNSIQSSEINKIIVTMDATFKDEETCRVAMETIVKDAHAAYGVNSHFWFTSEDGKSLFVLEQYQDKKALREAIRRFTFARISFFRSINIASVNIYGDVSTSSKLMFSALRAQYMGYFGGYSKDIAKDQEAGIKDFERDRVLVATNASFQDEGTCSSAMEAIVTNAYAATGVNSHFWFKSVDGKSLTIFEQYADEKALTEHVMENAASRSKLFESIEVSDVTIYGAVPGEVKETFAPLNPVYMSYFGGYSK